MTGRAVRHELADRPFVGTPRPLPRVLFCHVPLGDTGRACGRVWMANTEAEYEEHVKARQAHEVLCAARSELTLPH